MKQLLSLVTFIRENDELFNMRLNVDLHMYILYRNKVLLLPN